MDSLLSVLDEAGVINDEQSREIRSKAPSMKAKIGRSRDHWPGPSNDVSPAEVIGAFAIRAQDDKILDEDRVQETFAESIGLPYVKIDPLKMNAKLVTTLLVVICSIKSSRSIGSA